MLAESFERIHRSNLVGMGIIPLQYEPGESADSLQLTGRETFTVDLPTNLHTAQPVTVHVSTCYCLVIHHRRETLSCFTGSASRTSGHRKGSRGHYFKFKLNYSNFYSAIRS